MTTRRIALEIVGLDKLSPVKRRRRLGRPDPKMRAMRALLALSYDQRVSVVTQLGRSGYVPWTVTTAELMARVHAEHNLHAKKLRERAEAAENQLSVAASVRRNEDL